MRCSATTAAGLSSRKAGCVLPMLILGVFGLLRFLVKRKQLSKQD